MAWLKIDDNAPSHQKILRVSAAARWMWICGLAYCQRHRTDGLVPSQALATFGLAPSDKPRKLAAELALAGLWHAADGGFTVHDFLDWNDSAAERDEKSNEKGERQRKWREGKRGEARLQVRAVDASTASAADATPPPPPTPTPTPQPQPTPSLAQNANDDARVGGGRGPGLVMTSADYARKRETHRHVGARLHVPNVLHRELMTKLGGDDPDATLVAWYAELDAEVEASKEPIPDVFKWLRPRFVDWAAQEVEDAGMAAIEKWAREGDAADAAAKAARGAKRG